MTNSVPMIHSGHLMNLTNLVPCEVPYLLVVSNFHPLILRLEKAIEGGVCLLCVKKIGPTPSSLKLYH